MLGRGVVYVHDGHYTDCDYTGGKERIIIACMVKNRTPIHMAQV